jgi:glutamyl/glutaminyl-tRNA synthetase
VSDDRTGRRYRGRLAPSPTGLLHLGHARTFWTACERARAAGGTLIFRNEDLDRDRARPDFAQAMLEDLHWLGIRWDEGPDVGGPFGPYAQSERLALYLQARRRLLEGGWIYPCTCSRKDLARSAQAPHESSLGAVLDDEPVYPGICRPLLENMPRMESSGVCNWRFRVPDGEAVEFEDQRFGPQRFVAGRDFGDFLLWRRDDVPSYQLAVVVDDAAMRVTEVVRGADLLKSTARQLLLYRALGLADPQWYHCPVMTDGRGERLAKRHDALSLRGLREQGSTAEEIVDSLGRMLRGA